MKFDVSLQESGTGIIVGAEKRVGQTVGRNDLNYLTRKRGVGANLKINFCAFRFFELPAVPENTTITWCLLMKGMASTQSYVFPKARQKAKSSGTGNCSAAMAPQAAGCCTTQAGSLFTPNEISSDKFVYEFALMKIYIPAAPSNYHLFPFSSSGAPHRTTAGWAAHKLIPQIVNAGTKYAHQRSSIYRNIINAASERGRWHSQLTGQYRQLLLLLGVRG